MSEASYTEVDALVAEKIMVLSVLYATGNEWATDEQCAMPVGEPYTITHDPRDPDPSDAESRSAWTDTARVPHYSTSPDAAWQVVEKLIELGASVRVEWRNGARRWCVRVSPWVNTMTLAETSEPSMPLAVCRAALAAIGGS